MKTILVTGGCGFVGANLVRELDDGSTNVRVLDNLTMGNASDVDAGRVELIEGDILDVETVERAVKGVDVIVHLAAHTRVVESMQDPDENFRVNVQGTFNLLQSARAHGIDRFVFASTGGAIIGEVTPPVHEEMLPKPISPYGASKLAGEAYLSAFAGAYGLDTVALRFSNVYGPYSYHKGSVVAKYFKQILNGKELTVFGDGTQTRDFVYVGDVARAIATAIRADLAGFEVFNLGSGVETSVNELIEKIGPVVGNAMTTVNYADARRGEIYRNYTRIDKARSGLGFSPSIDLSQGLRLTWDWFNQNRDRLTDEEE
jgi:UDP-glucose 4-epimerase